MRDWEKIDELMKVGETEMAIGYLAYRVYYFGKDASGTDPIALTKANSKLRMYGHHIATDSSPFNQFVRQQRKIGQSLT